MAKKAQRGGEVMRLIAAAAQRGGAKAGSCDHDEDGHAPEEVGCTIRTLPDRLQAEAAGVAAAVNPVNMPQAYSALTAAMPDDPLMLTLLIGKYFGPAPRTLTVSFMEQTPTDLRNRIISHLNAWNNCCGIRFRYTSGTGQVRISRAGSGYWSYLGTDILLIPANRPTMNLQGFSMATPESEYRRVVRHEAGHTLGFPHEHMRKELVNRINPAKAYAYFAQTQGWSKAQVDAQVLTPLNQATILGTPADQTSIMCYRLPGSITNNGQPIVGGNDINATDCAFARRVYPKPLFAAGAAGQYRDSDEDGLADAEAYEDISADWSPEEDVDSATALEELMKESEPAD